jgi:glycosyltransferase involved in cell wall biosynthesis
MRIAIDARKIDDFGIGTYIRGLIGGLLEIGEDEIVAIAAPGAVLPPGVEHLVREAPKYSLRELVSVARGVRADVFHAPHYVVPFTTLPVVVTIHDLMHLRLRNPVKRAYARTMLRRAVRHTVVTVSETVRRDIESELGATGVRVTPNGVGSEMTPDGPRRPGGYFLFVGNDKPHKNAGAFVEAARRAGVEYLLAGAPFARYGEHALGFVRDLAPLYRGALALVMPSLDEGFGLPALEAMACGTPVITSEAPALLELTGDAALHAAARDIEALADAMRRVACDATLRASLAARGIERARSFTWRRCAESTREAYLAALR